MFNRAKGMVDMFSKKPPRFVAAGAAVVAVAIGGFAIGNSTSNSGASGFANAAQFGPPGQAPRLAGHAPPAGAPAPVAASGEVPQGWSPGMGTIITGPEADKAEAAAVAAGYEGTVNRVVKLSDGSYAVHLFATTGPHHVFVSTDFKITGTA
jgi:hypothetical protein